MRGNNKERGMILEQRMFLAVMLAVCSSCRLAADEEPGTNRWVEPMVQQVRVPERIDSGVFYPAHDEMVILRPGAWAKDAASAAASNAEPVVPAAKPSISAGLKPEIITMTGKMKLFEALRLIAETAGKELVLGNDVIDSELTLDVKNMKLANAIKGLLYPLEYGYKIDGDELIVLARDTRAFRVNRPPVTQAFDAMTTNESSSVGASSGVVSTGVSPQARVRVGAKVLVHNNADALSYWEDVEANVRNLVSKDGIVSVNKAAGVVVVTDTPRRLDQLGIFFDDMNARAGQQIMVDVKVVEVELSREYKLGIDWGALMSHGDLRGVQLATNFASENMTSGNSMNFTARVGKDGAGDTESGIKAVLKALESFGRIDVVSQPRVMMLNNSVASIQVGETKSYVESTNMETTQGGGTITSAALNEVHGGVTLQIVGSIAGEDVFLGVTPVVSSIDDIRTITLGGGSKLEAPDTSMKTMSTLVRVKDGHTVAIGGLITRDKRSEQHGVPFLSRVPLLGKVFSYEVRRNRRTELVIFMTPHRG